MFLPHKTFVGFPMTNTVIAAAFIRKNYGMGDDKELMGFVDAFMQSHPRGAGTAGESFLREVYAACRTIKVAQSRTKKTWNWGTYAKAARLLSRAQQDTLVKFNDPAKILTRSAGDITGRSKPYEELADLGMLGLYYDDRFSVIEAWITDYGIGVAKAAPWGAIEVDGTFRSVDMLPEWRQTLEKDNHA
jgi:hypothetical protein